MNGISDDLLHEQIGGVYLWAKIVCSDDIIAGMRAQDATIQYIAHTYDSHQHEMCSLARQT